MKVYKTAMMVPLGMDTLGVFSSPTETRGVKTNYSEDRISFVKCEVEFLEVQIPEALLNKCVNKYINHVYHTSHC